MKDKEQSKEGAPNDEGVQQEEAAPMDEGVQQEEAAPMDEGVQQEEAAPMDEGVQQITDIQDSSSQQQQLDEALREKGQFRTIAQRAQADLENYKKRVIKEREDLQKSATEDLILKLLAVVDDLDRAVELIPQDAVAPGWYDGLLLVMRNIGNILDSEGVHKVEALGQPFDPWKFEAVQYEESSEIEEGNVVRVLRNGYARHNKILRAAQVIIAKRPEIEHEHSEEDPK